MMGHTPECENSELFVVCICQEKGDDMTKADLIETMRAALDKVNNECPHGVSDFEAGGPCDLCLFPALADAVWALWEKAINVAGMWRCPTCGFILGKRVLAVNLGEVFANTRDESELCPNDGATMVPLTHEKNDELGMRALDKEVAEGNTLRAEVERLRSALEPFKSGGNWGTWQAYLVHGPETKEHGINAAKRITALQIAVDAALAPPGAEGRT